MYWLLRDWLNEREKKHAQKERAAARLMTGNDYKVGPPTG